MTARIGARYSSDGLTGSGEETFLLDRLNVIRLIDDIPQRSERANFLAPPRFRKDMRSPNTTTVCLRVCPVSIKVVQAPLGSCSTAVQAIPAMVWTLAIDSSSYGDLCNTIQPVTI